MQPPRHNGGETIGAGETMGAGETIGAGETKDEMTGEKQQHEIWIAQPYATQCKRRWRRETAKNDGVVLSRRGFGEHNTKPGRCWETAE